MVLRSPGIASAILAVYVCMRTYMCGGRSVGGSVRAVVRGKGVLPPGRIGAGSSTVVQVLQTWERVDADEFAVAMVGLPDVGAVECEQEYVSGCWGGLAGLPAVARV